MCHHTLWRHLDSKVHNLLMERLLIEFTQLYITSENRVRMKGPGEKEKLCILCSKEPELKVKQLCNFEVLDLALSLTKLSWVNHIISLDG